MKIIYKINRWTCVYIIDTSPINYKLSWIIQAKVYYYFYDGNLELYYDLNLNIVDWTYQGKQKKLIINHLKQVIYFPQKQRILILSDRQEISEDSPLPDFKIGCRCAIWTIWKTGIYVTFFWYSNRKTNSRQQQSKQLSDKKGKAILFKFA